MSKTALITGASKGIGAAVARLFAQKGYNVIIGYNHSEDLSLALKNELISGGFNAEALQVDVSSSASVKKFVAEAAGIFGDIDVLVNNAGIAQSRLLSDITDEDWKKMIATNLSGTFYCCRQVLPYFLKKQCGCIINISSIWGETGASMEVHYSASKAGIIGFTKALAKELGPSNIRVNCVAPGVIDTDMNKNLTDEDLNQLADETPLCRIGKPEEVAKAVYFLANDGNFITGQILGVNGGIVI